MPSVAVVSPFLDKRHGTERCISEQAERFARDFGYDVTLYSQRVEDIAGVTSGLNPPAASGPGRVAWRKIPALPGPHLANFLWWLLANQLFRWFDQRFRRARFDLIYSAGINCGDADVMSVHVLFAALRARAGEEFRFSGHSPATWLRVLHRRLYYRLAEGLERRYYTRRGVALVAISRKTWSDLLNFCGLPVSGDVVYHGTDPQLFSPEVRARLRASSRAHLGLTESSFAWLLVGNGWKNKGLPCLLEAAAGLEHQDSVICVVGQDDPSLYTEAIRRLGLAGRVRFLPVRRDVEAYYAAADAYVAPSLEDAFALPPAEAMASGLPVVVSTRAGLSELVTDGEDALLLRNPEDPAELRSLMQLLLRDSILRQRLGAHAAQAMRRLTWDQNAAEMDRIFRAVLESRKTSAQLANAASEVPRHT